MFISDIIIDAASATSVGILQQGNKRSRSLGIKLILQIKIYFLALCEKCNYMYVL